MNINTCCFTDRIALTRENRILPAACSMITANMNALTAYLPQLHIVEREYYDGLKSERRKQSYLLGRVAAKNALAAIAPENKPDSVFIGFGVFHFPVVKGLKTPNLQVSISHTGNIGVALAFEEEHPLGIDMEKVDDDHIDAIRDHISEQERALISACGIALSIGCTIVWSMKEAVSKVLRTGMTADFIVLEIDSLQRNGMFYEGTFKYLKQYKAVVIYVNEHACAVALPKKTQFPLLNFFNAFSAVTQKI